MPINSKSALIDGRVYLLADHLDAILAAGEDLGKLKVSRHLASDHATHETTNSINAFVARARELEIAAMGRIKQARDHTAALSRELTRQDHRFAILSNLFTAATAVVIEAIDSECNSDQHAFEHGFDPLVYLRKRGLIGSEVGCLAVVEAIEIDEKFLIAGQIELGPLLDMCARFLDVLDDHFDLFPEVPADEVQGDVDGPVPAIAAMRT